MSKKRLWLLPLGLLFLALMACTITGRATPTPKRFVLTVAVTAAVTAEPGGALPVPALPPAKVALPTVPALPTGSIEVPALATSLVAPVKTLLPNLPALPNLLSTRTPTPTPTATRRSTGG